jgi:hypothetical protein
MERQVQEYNHAIAMHQGMDGTGGAISQGEPKRTCDKLLRRLSMDLQLHCCIAIKKKIDYVRCIVK